VDHPDHPENRPGSVPRQPHQGRTPVAEPALRRYRGPTCQKLLESGKRCGGGATKASGHTRCPRHSDVPESEKAKWWLAGGLHATRVEGIPDAPPVDLDTLAKITSFCALLATEGLRGRLHEARLIALDRVANTARLAIETAERIGYENVPVLTPTGSAITSPAGSSSQRRSSCGGSSRSRPRDSAHGASPIPSNAEGAPAPQPRRGGRPQAWDPATIYAMLTRPLYRGEIVWNQTKKRNAWGVQAQRPRAEADWLRVPAPELRIVSEPLWLAVERRLASMRTFYLRSTDGKLHGRARGANGHESQYLLTGLAACGTCAGGLTVHSRAWGTGRQQTYVCGHYHRKGTTVCTNRRVLPMIATNTEVLRSIETTCLSPAAVERIVEGALEALTRPPEAPRRVKQPSGTSSRPSKERSHATRRPSARRRTSRHCSRPCASGSASGPRFAPSSRGFGDSEGRVRSTAASWNDGCAPWLPTGAG